MLRLASFDVVFQEIPGEVTLALNLSGCPNRCAGCHSPHLGEEVGEPLDDNLLNSLLSGYGNALPAFVLWEAMQRPAMSRIGAPVCGLRPGAG